MISEWSKKVFVLIIVCIPIAVVSQDIFKGRERLFTPPKKYIASYTKDVLEIDGSLEDEAWNKAPWSDSFIDIEGNQKPSPALNTKMKMLWNDSCLFVAARLEDPHVWANLLQHDQIIFYDNDFEIFIDPNNDTHQYFEIEVNAYNTILDLFMVKPYRNWAGALIPFDIPKLRSAVKIHGTLNDPSDIDEGWTVEMSIPFRALFLGNYWRAPNAESLWRINFSRVQWHTEVVDGKYQKKKDVNGKILAEENWVWSPQGLINMHYPERWGYLKFTKENDKQDFELPYSEEQRKYLWLLYYRQKDYYHKHHKYAISLKNLDFKKESIEINNRENKIVLEATTSQFTIYIGDTKGSWSINEQGLVQAQNKIP